MINLTKGNFNISGIYSLTNIKNGKRYIGKSVNIQKRYYAHISESKNSKLKAYNFEISKALREFPNDFILEILEECDVNDLFEKEKYYIKKYNSLIPNGYNMTEGGDSGPVRIGESNGRAKLTEEEVFFIRTKLLEGYNFRQVYPLFQDKISERGLKHVWWGTSWVNIMPEIYEDREKLFSNKRKGTKNDRRAITQSEYNEIIVAKQSGKDRKKYWEEYFQNKCSLPTFNNYWYEYIKREDGIAE